MPTNEERRKVARCLRGNPKDTIIPHKKGRNHGMGCHEAADRFWDICDRIKEAGKYDIAFSSTGVLADLIEPAKTGFNTFSGVCPKCGGSIYVFCDDYDWWTIICDSCGATHGFEPDRYIPYGEIENEWKESINAN